jgi:hypothetical protein
MKTSGNFFAIGKPQWNAVCDLGLNPAVSFLVMARGTGADNATTAWSMNSIETYGGITWRRARDAVDILATANITERTKAGSKPRYKLAKPDSVDDLIWLPNELITGAGKEIAPIHRIRQAGDVETLRLFVGLYAEQDLTGDGGIPRDLLHEHYERTKIMDMAQYAVFGFNRPETRYATNERLFERFKAAGNVWDYLKAIEQLGLVEWVKYLAESCQPDAELIHALSGDEWADDAAMEATLLADELPGGFRFAAHQYDFVIPVAKHMKNAAVVSVARLVYRPKTSRTSSWLAKHIESCKRFSETYEMIRRGEAVKVA